MTAAKPITQADVEWAKSRLPPKIVDEMIEDGTYVVIPDTEEKNND